MLGGWAYTGHGRICKVVNPVSLSLSISTSRYLTKTGTHTHAQRGARMFSAASFVIGKNKNQNNLSDPCWRQGAGGQLTRHAACIAWANVQLLQRRKKVCMDCHGRALRSQITHKRSSHFCLKKICRYIHAYANSLKKLE